MRRSDIVRGAVGLALALAATTACASLRGRSGPPSVEELAQRYGCDRAQVEQNRAARQATVAPGAPLCGTLGRFGEPVSVNTQEVADMRLLSLLHRAGDRYVTVTYVYYADTPVNRKIGRKVGAWTVQRVAESR